MTSRVEPLSCGVRKAEDVVEKLLAGDDPNASGKHYALLHQAPSRSSFDRFVKTSFQLIQAAREFN